MDSTSPVTVERREHVAVVWLDRPDQRNAFAPTFWTSFPAVIDELGDDPEIRAIVIAAKGSAFTVGIDLKAFGPALVTGNIDPTAPPPASPVAQRTQTRRLVNTMQRDVSSLAE
ncbi:MAG: enoyl-CoA hydratase-related protein, partial [Actinomycetota bacterium]|nr:enoyl-CoA hydratase-related protein [Actinomycetota bacterium]